MAPQLWLFLKTASQECGDEVCVCVGGCRSMRRWRMPSHCPLESWFPLSSPTILCQHWVLAHEPNARWELPGWGGGYREAQEETVLSEHM